jgi:hypothetical protein
MHLAGTDWKAALFLATLAGLIITARGAAPETLGTACMSKSGEVYALAPYRSAPRNSCLEGDETVRLSLHQPNTAFAKRRNTIGPDSYTIMTRLFQHQDVLIALRSGSNSLEPGHCDLVVDDLVNATEDVVVSVPAGSWQDGIREVTHIDHGRSGPDGGSLVETYETDQLILTPLGAVVFHDLLVDNRGSDCFAAFLVESAEDLRHLYDR